MLLLIGLVILIAGAEFLVRGASSLAKKLGISALVIGLTIVSFGTSAPELIVNILSALNGSTDLAIGNILGSNIANILLILGVSAAISPLMVQRSTIWKEIPFALLAAILVFIMGNDILFDHMNENVITRSDGLGLMSIMIIFMYYAFSIAKSKDTKEESEEVKTYTNWLAIVMTLVGIFGLFLGGKMLVDNAVKLAELAGLSEAFIGLTIVAIGTSLPELATSIIAAIRGQNDIAIGNVVGSNIFNIFWILGLTSTIFPIPVGGNINFDIMVTVIATLLLFLAMFVGHRHKLERWQGAGFVLLYFTYIGYLVVNI